MPRPGVMVPPIILARSKGGKWIATSLRLARASPDGETLSQENKQKINTLKLCKTLTSLTCECQCRLLAAHIGLRGRRMATCPAKVSSRLPSVATCLWTWGAVFPVPGFGVIVNFSGGLLSHGEECSSFDLQKQLDHNPLVKLNIAEINDNHYHLILDITE